MATDAELDLAFVNSLREAPGPGLGPAIFGLFLDAFLLALILVIVLYWHIRLSKGDPTVLRWFVYYLTANCLAHSAICLATCMDYFVFNYGNYDVWLYGWWWKGLYIMEILIVFPVEAFYIYRAYQIWERRLVVLCGLSVLLAAWTSLGITVLAMYPTNWRYSADGMIFWSWGGMLVMIDWSVSALIAYGLLRKRGGFMHSEVLMKKIIWLSAEAQLVPSLVALTFVLKSIIAPSSNIAWAFMSIPKMWALPCLIVVASRFSLRQQMEEHRAQAENTFRHGLTPSETAWFSGQGEKANLPLDVQQEGEEITILPGRIEEGVVRLSVEMVRPRTARPDDSSEPAMADDKHLVGWWQRGSVALPFTPPAMKRSDTSRISAQSPRESVVLFEEMLR